MPVTKTKKVPMSCAERQKKYLENPENMAKHKQRQKDYYKNVIKPKRDALKRQRDREVIGNYVQLVEQF
jgi:hypothetical protein